MNQGLIFRDPHAFLQEYILQKGYEDQTDQLMLDIVRHFTREKALEVFHVLDTRISNKLPITKEELHEFILSAGLERGGFLHPEDRVLH